MKKRALVLGGGGPVGIAWESGLLAGLAEAGLDLSDADFILGTSAGSVVGAQLAMGRPAVSLAAPFLSDDDQPPSPSQLLGSAPPDLTTLVTKMAEAASGKRPPEETRAEIGAWALQASTMSEDTFIASFGRYIRDFPEGAWPGHGFCCTAVDTSDGRFIVWNQDSHVSLASAVASSCSVPGIYPPVTINGRRYMDGGMRTATNADVAKGHDVVFVVAIALGDTANPMAALFRRRLEAELDVVRQSGSRLELILPDTPSIEAFGLNLMDFRRRPGAAKAGLAQGRANAGRLRELWRGA